MTHRELCARAYEFVVEFANRDEATIYAHSHVEDYMGEVAGTSALMLHNDALCSKCESIPRTTLRTETKGHA